MKNDEFANGLFAYLARARNDYPDGKISKDGWLQLVGNFYAESKKPKPKQKAAVMPTNAPKPRNLLFDALTIVDRHKLSEKLTKMAAAQIGVALKQIKEATPDVTPEEIARRAARYAAAHPSWALTSTALCKHWGEFGPGDSTKASLSDPYVEPSNWRPVALKIFPDALDWGRPHDFRALGWNEFDLALRRKIQDVLRNGGSKL